MDFKVIWSEEAITDLRGMLHRSSLRRGGQPERRAKTDISASSALLFEGQSQARTGREG